MTGPFELFKDAYVKAAKESGQDLMAMANAWQCLVDDLRRAAYSQPKEYLPKARKSRKGGK